MGIGETWSIFGWTWGAFAVLIIYFIWRMTMEDDLLQEASGKEWTHWTGHVPYKFVPGV
ncbi:hypothetical protein BD779DRAFT_1558608, partial [Infundibulicybe gibba]